MRVNNVTSRSLWDVLLHEMKSWPNSSNEVTDRMISMICNHARGGALLVQAPTGVLAELLWEYTDNGYLQRRLGREDAGHVLHSGQRFATTFAEFTEHVAGDRWPADYPDPDARGLPKDGGLAISPTGAVRLAAVKFRVNLDVPFTWAGTGTRHATAFALAHGLSYGLVVARSDAGSVHLVTSRSAREGLVYCLQRRSRAARPPLAQAHPIRAPDKPPCVLPVISEPSTRVRCH